MLERLRGQLPMAVNAFHLVGNIFSAGAADAALAAASGSSTLRLSLVHIPVCCLLDLLFVGLVVLMFDTWTIPIERAENVCSAAQEHTVED